MTIPASVRVICEKCFYKRISLSCVTFARGSRLQRIEKEAFYQCMSLEEAEIPATVEVLGEDCFSGSGITSVRFPRDSKLKSIERGAMSCCLRLEVFEIPASVKVVRHNSFYACKMLNLRVHRDNCHYKVIDSLLMSSDGAEVLTCFQMGVSKITIPASVEVVDEQCFMGYPLSCVTFE